MKDFRRLKVWQGEIREPVKLRGGQRSAVSWNDGSIKLTDEG